MHANELEKEKFLFMGKKCKIYVIKTIFPKPNCESENSQIVIPVKVAYYNRLRPFLNKTHM